MSVLNTLKSFLREEEGATAIEYGLIAALVSVAAIAALEAMGTSLVSIFGVVDSELQNAAGSAGGSAGTTDGGTTGTGG